MIAKCDYQDRAFFCPFYGRNLAIFPLANHIFFSQFLTQNSQFQRSGYMLSNKGFKGIRAKKHALLMGMTLEIERRKARVKVLNTITNFEQKSAKFPI